MNAPEFEGADEASKGLAVRPSGRCHKAPERMRESRPWGLRWGPACGVAATTKVGARKGPACGWPA